MCGGLKVAHFRAGDHFMAVPNFILVALHLALRRHAQQRHAIFA
jgi:hypothetical protein